MDTLNKCLLSIPFDICLHSSKQVFFFLPFRRGHGKPGINHQSFYLQRRQHDGMYSPLETEGGLTATWLQNIASSKHIAFIWIKSVELKMTMTITSILILTVLIHSFPTGLLLSSRACIGLADQFDNNSLLNGFLALITLEHFIQMHVYAQMHAHNTYHSPLNGPYQDDYFPLDHCYSLDFEGQMNRVWKDTLIKLECQHGTALL